MQPVRRSLTAAVHARRRGPAGRARLAPPGRARSPDRRPVRRHGLEHPVRAGEQPPDPGGGELVSTRGLAAHQRRLAKVLDSSGRTWSADPPTTSCSATTATTRSPAPGQGRHLGRLGPAQQPLRPARRAARRRGQRLHLPQPRDDDRRGRPGERHDPRVLRPGDDRLRPRHARPRPDPRERRVQDAQLRADPALLPVRIEAERRLQAARRDARGAGGARSAATGGSRRRWRHARVAAAGAAFANRPPRGKGRRRRGARPVARGLTPGPRPARPRTRRSPAGSGTSTTLPVIPPASA